MAALILLMCAGCALYEQRSKSCRRAGWFDSQRNDWWDTSHVVDSSQRESFWDFGGGGDGGFCGGDGGDCGGGDGGGGD